MDIKLSAIPNAIKVVEGLPRPNWQVVGEWIDANTEPSDLNEAWTILARDWLNGLVQMLPDGYVVAESAEFLLVTNDESRFSKRLLSDCERARRTILSTLAGVARDEGYGKHVLVAFGDTERYYDYITEFYPDEGEFALSGGVFLNNGYGHIAICLAYGDEHERTIAHEMNHALLRHLPLPLWLNEGVTQFMEDVVVDSSCFVVDNETVRRHRDYWNRDTIHSFWSGESFFSPDDGQELSYHLAHVLFRNLMSDYPKRMKDFLNSANWSDAGDSALRTVCGVTLGDCVCQFLGDGVWNPRTAYSDMF